MTSLVQFYLQTGNILPFDLLYMYSVLNIVEYVRVWCCLHFSHQT